VVLYLLPTAVTSISPGKYQVRWRIDCSPFERQESTLRLLCIVFGRDPVCTNVRRIPCPPGYLSCKYDTTYSISVEYPSDSTWNPDAFRPDFAAANTILLFCSIPSQKHSRKHTNSDHDWAWLWHDLGHGKDARKVCQRWFRVAPIYPGSLLLRPAGSRCRNQPNFGSSEVSRWMTVSRCLKFVVASRFPLHSAPFLGARLRSLRRDCPAKDCLISSRR
jgi:DNA primase RepB-like protein